jgi:hypothetical protein
MTTTITTTGGAVVEGVRIVDMPDLGAFTSGSSVVGELAGSGRFGATALGNYFLPLSGGKTVTGHVDFNVTPPGTDAGVADFDFLHQTPTLTATASNLHFVQRTILEPGPNDATNYWGIVSRARTSSTSMTANLVGAYFQTWRLAGSVAPMWAAITESSDITGLDSVNNAPTSSMEIDLSTSGLDNATNPSKWGGFGNRHMIHFVAVRNQGTAENEISTGLWFGTTNTRLDSVIGFSLNCRAYQVLDTRGVIAPLGITERVAAVRMQATQIIDFNGGPNLNSPASRSMFYIQTTAPGLRYFADNTELFRIQDDGVVLSSGTYQAPVVTVTADAGLHLTAQTNSAAAAAGTLTNAPSAGNPSFWLKVSINGTTLKIPAWT